MQCLPISPPPARSRPAARGRPPALALVCAFLLAVPVAAAGAVGLEGELGRNEVRVYSAPFPVETGRTVTQLGLPERLERLDYRRVRGKPATAGEYFWGTERFWVYRRAFGTGPAARPAELFGLALGDDGRVTGFLEAGGGQRTDRRGRPVLEPEILAESLAADRARRRPVGLEELPEHVWRSVLAAEDHRFFEHAGVDAIGVARALLANALAGRVTQGGSTITQQLVKARDLSPARTLGRKLSEAVRALALEAEYDKRAILEEYLNQVYLGQADGLAIHGLGAAARRWFGKPATALDLGEAATLAAMIQGPNRLDPGRRPERVRERQLWVLGRMAELGWASAEAVERERRRGLPKLAPAAPEPPTAPHLVAWIGEEVERAAPRRVEEGRGVVVETALDPLLQAWAEEAAVARLTALERAGRRDARIALVALDATTGRVLAYVGGDPRSAAARSGFDHARRARRQPASTLKPLVLLEAFDDCGDREPVYPARRVLDQPLTLELPGGPWQPDNLGRAFRGPVDLREALVASLNVPFVRLARHCGFGEVAATARSAGLELPAAPPPAFVLGAVETTPLALAGAYTAFAAGGVASRPLPLRRIVRPAGGLRLAAFEPRRERVAGAAAAYLVRDLLRAVVVRGTGSRVGFAEPPPWGKTGSSPRDAWFAGGAGSVVAVAWVGSDAGGASGAADAAPLWSDFMARAAAARPPLDLPAPPEIVVRWVEDDTGLLLKRPRRGAHTELFDRRHLPPPRRLLLPDAPLPPIE